MRARAKKFFEAVRRQAVWTFVVFLAGSAIVLACSWSFTSDHSVRFNSYRTGRGFYRLDPLPIVYDANAKKELTANQVTGEDEEPTILEPIHQAESNDKIVASVHEAISESRLDVADRLLRKLLEDTEYRSIDEDPARQERRNSAFDMLDALKERRRGVSAVEIKAYLDARTLYDRSVAMPEPPEKIALNLRDNWAYLQAAELYRDEKLPEALEAFLRHASTYPTSEKNQAVLYMVAKLRIELSHAFKESDCGIQGEDYNGQPLVAEPVENCRDENWKQAITDLKLLMNRYPRGRFVNDARGWLAYLYRRGGMREMALAEYYRLLGHPTDRNARLEAKKSLQVLGHEYDDETLDKTEELIIRDINAAMAYAYHRIYNHAVDLTYAERSYYGSYREQMEERKEVSETQAKGRHELERVARFASRMMKRYPTARVSGGFVVRLAQAQIELEDYAEAEVSASRALSLGVSGELRAEALFIKASSEHAQRKYEAAKRTLRTLLRDLPDSRHYEHSRRLLALAAEDTGDLEGALEQYLALGYRFDVAYFIDVLLPTERLEKFIETRTNAAELSYLRYSLGVRLMREKEWEKARRILNQVVTSEIPIESYDYSWPPPRRFEKDPYQYNYNGIQIGSTWIRRDLKTIETFQYWEKRVAEAADDESKAEALYQLASAYYQSDSLTFYNPAAWDGQRSDLLASLESGESLRLPGEMNRVFEHSQLHESIAHSIPIYLEVVDKYPDTAAAKDALFSAVIAHERLGDLNYYWREIYSSGLFAGPRLVTNADINGRFPKFKWPLSRLGWEPATRTVNGGPAYPPPPKPAPKLSFTQRVERKVLQYGPAAKEFAREIWTPAEAGLRHLLMYSLFGFGLFLYWRHRMLK